MTRAPKIASPVGRGVKEWIGATPDSKAPPHVLLRVFQRAKGACHISGRQIRPGDKWEAEHIVALHAGGENKESNLAPALVEPHKEKTAAERREKAKIDAVAKKHIGAVSPPAQPIKSRGFARAEKEPKRPTKTHAGVSEIARRFGMGE